MNVEIGIEASQFLLWEDMNEIFVAVSCHDIWWGTSVNHNNLNFHFSLNANLSAPILYSCYFSLCPTVPVIMCGPMLIAY